MKLFNLKWAMLALMAACALVSCSDDNENENKIVEGTDMWGEVLRGDNMTLQFYPDHFAYYWEYTFSSEENPDLGLVIEGEFPDARFLSYNVYDDDLQSSKRNDYSVMDVDIKPEAGSINPFNGGSWSAGQKYTIYVMPADAPAKYTQDAKNVIWFDADVKKVCTILRYYIPQGDGIHGGVGMPKVKAIDLKSGKYVSAPKRVLSGLRGEMELPGATFNSSQRMNFFRAPFAYAYPNGPAEYCYSRNTLEVDSVMFFNFKAPAQGDMRYWSVCVGNDETYTPLAISDYQTKIDADGFANYVLIDTRSAMYEQVKAIAEEKGYNLFSWKGDEWHDGVMILYRNMVFADDYAHSLRKLLAVDQSVSAVEIMTNPQKYICLMALGQWGAFGVKTTAMKFVGSHMQLGTFPLRQALQQQQ